jgi:hypothetical protein
MHVSTRMNSVCKEPELAGAIESSVAVAVVVVLKVAVFVLVLAAAAADIDVRNCGMLANTRTSSVCKGLGPVRAIEKRANIRGLILCMGMVASRLAALYFPA